MKYAAVIAKTGNGYSAYAPDVPGCVAAGDTFSETETLLREAIALHIEALLEQGEALPTPASSIDDAIVHYGQPLSREVNEALAHYGAAPPAESVTFAMVDVETAALAAAGA